MEANKIILNGQTLIDLTEDDVEPSDVTQGKWVHLASGERVQGTASGGGTVAPEFVKFTNFQGTSLDISWLDTSNMTDMSYMISGENLEELTIGIGFDTRNAVEATMLLSETVSIVQVNYAGTKAQFLINCGALVDSLVFIYQSSGNTITVYCSDTNFVIDNTLAGYSLVGTMNGWDTHSPDYKLANLGNDLYQRNNVSFTYDSNGIFCGVITGSWSRVITYNNTTFTGFTEAGKDVNNYIDANASSQDQDNNIIYLQGFVANVTYNASTQTATVEYVSDIA